MCTRLNTHLQLLKSYYNPVQNSWDASAIATFEIMHFPYFFHGAVSTSWIRVFFMTINITWGRGGHRGNRLLQPVHSQAFILGEADYELALSVSSCNYSLKRHLLITDTFFRSKNLKFHWILKTWQRTTLHLAPQTEITFWLSPSAKQCGKSVLGRKVFTKIWERAIIEKFKKPSPISQSGEGKFETHFQ